ncbi:DDE-type integrase/transposase/recombinase [Hydrogenophaga sp. PBL-H3]|uniref:DDE-type integrase/transposase/recombinase n=1 Tax=Hydrogenophaga sp. PBL-H3 TaxID=434010 RepID=UPI00135C7015|nr:DDE-type integrase/transposase/recombinase [Hydrogenophaga sp. PBL-H3]
MVRFHFKRGLRFLENGLVWVLQRRSATGKIMFEEESGESPSQALTVSEVYEKYLGEHWRVDESSLGPGKELMFSTPKDIRALGDRDAECAAMRGDYLTKLHQRLVAEGERWRCVPKLFTHHLKNIARERGDKKAPGWSTVWNWWKRYEATRCITKLADHRRTGRTRDVVQFSVFEEVIAEVFLTPQKQPGKTVCDAMEDRIQRINEGLSGESKISTPAKATVYRWLKDLNHAVVLRAREGKEASERQMRGTMQGLRVNRILERYEIDHTPVDVLVVCKLTRMVLGRPWLTLVIDRKSRMIAGFYLSFHAPSAYSVLYALRMAILPKDDLLKAIPGLHNPWPVRGLPRLIATDNGMDLHSHALETFCMDAAIELLFCGVAHPEMKGAIERLFGTLSRDLFHTLPGTVFASIDQRGDYPSGDLAALDLDTLTMILVKWIVDKYHCTPHRGLGGNTPLYSWQEDEASTSIDLPAYPRQLDVMVGQSANRTAFKYGIEYDCIRYNSDALLSFREEKKKSPIVEIRVYEHDVSFIDVLDENLGEFIRVPAVDQAYCQGLTRHVHLMVRQEVNRRFGNQWQQQQLLEVKREIQAMVAAAMKAHKAGKRKQAAAQSMVDSNDVLNQHKAAFEGARRPSGMDSEEFLHTVPSASPLPKYTWESHV